MSHSPGPFRVGGEFSYKCDEIEDANGKCIAAVWVRWAPPLSTTRHQFTEDPVGRANANLFAAAPDLLEACKRLRSRLDEHMGDYDDGYEDDDPDMAAMQLASAAIAKASAIPAD